MKRSILVAVLFVFACAVGLGQPVPKMSAERLDDRIIVRMDDETFTVYRFGAGQKYPYFYPVNGPVSGLSVTTESSLPWPHHRSLFFGCDKVNGGNYWQEGNDRGQIVSRGAKISKNGPDYVEITDQCDWRQPGQAAIIVDTRTIRIYRTPEGNRFIDFKVVLDPQTDVVVQKTNHSLFAARVVPALSVNKGGVLINAAGNIGEKATQAVPSPWADYSGTQCSTKEGIAIFDSPGNPWFPSKWFTRDYGFFSPTPLDWLDEKGWQLPAGKKVELNYRVVVHPGDSKDAKIETLFQKWAEEQKAGKVN